MDRENDIEQAIAKDLALCDLGLALTKGKARQQYRDHRKLCFDELNAMNERDGLNSMTDSEILDALLG